MTDLPEFYFRVRENGAAVFRLADAARDRRLELEPIAAVNVRNGEVKPHGGRPLAPGESAAIADWLAARRQELARRELDEVRRVAETLNQTAHWAQSRAADDDLEAVTELLLLAMHDLRSVLVRRKAERVLRARGDESPGPD